MANSLKCQVCDKPATVHLTQIVNNKIHKVDLCEACAQAKGVTDPSGFSLADLLVNAVTGAEAGGEQLNCGQCGFTQAHFKKIGRLGCPVCWTSLRDQLEPILGTMHRGLRHVGKSPERSLARRQVVHRLNQLRDELKQAISNERYEDAARFRDEITKIQNTLQPEESAHAT
jgi:protein arginine kinase activator